MRFYNNQIHELSQIIIFKKKNLSSSGFSLLENVFKLRLKSPGLVSLIVIYGYYLLYNYIL